MTMPLTASPMGRYEMGVLPPEYITTMIAPTTAMASGIHPATTMAYTPRTNAAASMPTASINALRG